MTPLLLFPTARLPIVLALVLLLGMLLVPQTSRAQAKIYWTDSGSSSIHRANTDGTEHEALVVSDIAFPRGIAVDATTGFVYWAEAELGEIRRSGLDGSGTTVLIANLDSPSEVALDLTAGKMYWTDMGAGLIQRSNLDGSGVEDLVTAGLSQPDDLALDLGGGMMYWSDSGTKKIQRSSLDGTSVEDLVSGLQGAAVMHYGISLDLTSNKLYWANGQESSVYRANLDGTSTEVFIGGEPFIQGAVRLQIDSAASTLYLLRPRAVQGDLYRINLDLTGFLELTSPKMPFGLDLSNGKVYWSDPGTSSIQRAEPDGSQIEIVVESPAPLPRAFTLDEVNGKMYWTTRYADIVQRANLNGSSVEVMISDDDLPGVLPLTTEDVTINTSAGKIYFSDGWGGVIWSAEPDGSGVEVLTDFFVSSGGWPTGLAVDVEAGKLYWNSKRNFHGIGRINLDGSELEELVSGSIANQPDDLVLDLEGGKMYWTDIGTNTILRSNLDGTGMEELVNGLNGGTEPMRHLGLTLDLPSSKMYWTESGAGAIRRANLDGTNIEDVITGLRLPTGIAVSVLDIADQIMELLDDVNVLMSDITIVRGQANALATTLAQALKKYEQGKLRVTLNLVVAFINQAEALVAAGVLSDTEGQQLLGAAQALISRIESELSAETASREALDATAESSPPFELTSAFPNPFNPSTTIGFSVLKQSQVSITVFDVLGRQVRTLLDGVIPAGEYKTIFEAADLPSGIYIIRIDAPPKSLTKRVVLLK